MCCATNYSARALCTEKVTCEVYCLHDAQNQIGDLSSRPLCVVTVGWYNDNFLLHTSLACLVTFLHLSEGECVDGRILYLRALQGHSASNFIDPTLQDNVVIGSGIFQYIYHIGCAFNLHSIINSGLVPGGSRFEQKTDSILLAH